MWLRSLCLTAFCTLALACQSPYENLALYTPTTRPVAETGLTALQPIAELDAVCRPPVKWDLEPPQSTPQHTRMNWTSPTGKTAFGVIRISLPLPLPPKWVLGPFLNEMKKSEGEARLVGAPLADPALPGLRFTAEGGRYKIRTNLICKNFTAWAIYAGTLSGQAEIPEELTLAEQAREQVRVGLEQQPPAAAPAP